MHGQDTIIKLKNIISSLLESQGYILVDIRFYVNCDKRRILEVLVDRIEGGIRLQECAQISKDMGVLIDESGLDLEGYVLEVSSPGLDRPLKVCSDFKRVIGKKITAYLKEPIEGRLEYCGILESAEDSGIIIKTQTTNVQIPLDKLNKAKQVIL